MDASEHPGPGLGTRIVRNSAGSVPAATPSAPGSTKIRRKLTLHKGDQSLEITANNVAGVRRTVGLKPWTQTWVDLYAATLVPGDIAYYLTVEEMKTWVLARGAVDGIDAYLANPLDNEATDLATDWKAARVALHAETAALGLAATNQQVYGLFGQRYDVAGDPRDPNHFYLTRHGAHEHVQYQGKLKGENARDMVAALVAGKRNEAVAGAQVVDEFACAFVAESRRWTPEHIFNLIATTQGANPMTGQPATAAPMASGTTWEPDVQRIGKETPKRAVRFADKSGLKAIVEQAHGDHANEQNFMKEVRQNLGLQTL